MHSGDFGRLDQRSKAAPGGQRAAFTFGQVARDCADTYLPAPGQHV